MQRFLPSGINYGRSKYKQRRVHNLLSRVLRVVIVELLELRGGHVLGGGWSECMLQLPGRNLHSFARNLLVHELRDRLLRLLGSNQMCPEPLPRF